MGPTKEKGEESKDGVQGIPTFRSLEEEEEVP